LNRTQKEPRVGLRVAGRILSPPKFNDQSKKGNELQFLERIKLRLMGRTIPIRDHLLLLIITILVINLSKVRKLDYSAHKQPVWSTAFPTKCLERRP
jgi:hypothetical protein